MIEKPKNLKFGSNQPSPAVILQVAPMIDILFQMICFYLVVGQLVTGQKDPDVHLPAMASLESHAENPAELVINLRPDGLVSVGGTDMPLRTLHELLRGELAKASAGKEPLRVVVRADRDQRFAKLDDVLRTCRQAGCQQVVFRALEKEGS